MKYSIYTLTVLSFLAPIELYSKEGVPAGNSVKIAKSIGDSQKLKQRGAPHQFGGGGRTEAPKSTQNRQTIRKPLTSKSSSNNEQKSSNPIKQSAPKKGMNWKPFPVILAQKIGLGDGKTKEFLKILKEFRNKAAEIRKDNNLSIAEKKDAFKKAHQSKMDQLKELLNERQLVEIKQIWRQRAKPKNNEEKPVKIKHTGLSTDKQKKLSLARQHAAKKTRAILKDPKLSEVQKKQSIEEIKKQLADRSKEIIGTGSNANEEGTKTIMHSNPTRAKCKGRPDNNDTEEQGSKNVRHSKKTTTHFEKAAKRYQEASRKALEQGDGNKADILAKLAIIKQNAAKHQQESSGIPFDWSEYKKLRHLIKPKDKKGTDGNVKVSKEKSDKHSGFLNAAKKYQAKAERAQASGETQKAEILKKLSAIKKSAHDAKSSKFDWSEYHALRGQLALLNKKTPTANR